MSKGMNEQKAINQHTIEVLEFPKVIAAIREKCITPFGSPEVNRISPMFDLQVIQTRQAEISEMVDLIRFGSALPLSRIDDCREEIGLARAEGAFLDPEEIKLVLDLIEVSNALHAYDAESRAKAPHIDAYLTRLRAFPELKQEIRKTIDEDGEIRDSASRELKRIRMDLRSTRQKIISRLEGILGSQRKQQGWQDDVVTQRNGRYVIPILAGNYKSDEGILHDRSQSGATFYVEPNQTVELNNKIHMLTQEERAEIVRILKALTAEIAVRADALLENTRLIGKLDAIHAAGGFAVDIKAAKPVVVDRCEIDLIDVRHPLLVKQLGDIEQVVPLSLRLDDNRRAILITGPNTGGKTVALKTVGLTVLMSQSGLLVAADEKSTIGIFPRVYADIGDEQSIELSLSTFSSHMRNIIHAVEHVTGDTLVLLDEIGAGTDPKEGAALAESIILHLVRQGARLLSSTHYSQLKTLALDHAEIENASLEFDRRTLAPTYRLQMGIPGSSYAVEIAGRLGMPKSVCENAAGILGTSERSLAELISSLETELAQVREDRANLTERLEKAQKLEEYYKAQIGQLEAEVESRRTQALKETEELLELSRKEIEHIVADIRRTQAEGQRVKDAHKFLRETSERVHRLQRQQHSVDQTVSDPTRFAKGDAVRILSLKQEGEIDEILSGERARVRVGAVNTVVELRNLEKLDKPQKGRRTTPVTATPDVSDISPEIHLRGMTGEEAKLALDQFLDRAVVAGLSQVYVVHGKGTGALRRVLSEYLKEHREVDSIRLGNWNEGGAGVTIVKLKS